MGIGLCKKGKKSFKTHTSIQFCESSNLNPSPHALTGAFGSVDWPIFSFIIDGIISTSELCSSSIQRYEPTVFSQPYGHDCSTSEFSHSLMSENKSNEKKK